MTQAISLVGWQKLVESSLFFLLFEATLLYRLKTLSFHFFPVVQVAKQAQLKVAVHHGVGRDMDPDSLAEYDVVITTYGTLRSEHRQSESDGLFG